MFLIKLGICFAIVLTLITYITDHNCFSFCIKNVINLKSVPEYDKTLQNETEILEMLIEYHVNCNIYDYEGNNNIELLALHKGQIQPIIYNKISQIILNKKIDHNANINKTISKI